MVWIFHIAVALYSLLTIAAALSQLVSRGFHMNYLMFSIFSIIMFSSLFIVKKEIMIAALIIAFIGLHATAVIEGLTRNNQLKYSHHIVRLVIHIIIVIMAIIL